MTKTSLILIEHLLAKASDPSLGQSLDGFVWITQGERNVYILILNTGERIINFFSPAKVARFSRCLQQRGFIHQVPDRMSNRKISLVSERRWSHAC
jgi:hypothetical protein